MAMTITVFRCVLTSVSNFRAEWKKIYRKTHVILALEERLGGTCYAVKRDGQRWQDTGCTQREERWQKSVEFSGGGKVIKRQTTSDTDKWLKGGVEAMQGD